MTPTLPEFIREKYELPSNIECEAALIGAMLIDNSIITIARQKLQPDDFYEGLHGRLFKAMLKFEEKGTLANPVTLKPVLQNDPALKQLGGMAYLAQLTGNSAALIGARDFIDQIQILSSRRKAIIAFVDGIDLLLDTSEDIDDTLDIIDAVEDQTRLATARDHRETVRQVGSATRSARDRMKAADAGVMIGATCRTVPQLDEVIGKVERSTLNVLGGRPGQGKTSLAISAATGYAANGFASEFFHLEMSAEQLDLRVVSDLSEMIGRPIAHKGLKEGRLDQSDVETLDRIDQMQDLLPIEFTALKAGTDVRRLESMIVRAKRKWEKRRKKLWCVWIDYLQLLGASSRGQAIEDPFKRVEAVCFALNAMKQKHDIAIFALAQLGRDVDRRSDKRPLMSDIKLSGQIEQDADSIFFSFRPEYYLEQAAPPKGDTPEWKEWEAEWQAARDKLEIIGGKNRHGAPASRTAKFLKDYYAVRSPLRRTEYDDPLLQRDLFRAADDDATEF